VDIWQKYQKTVLLKCGIFENHDKTIFISSFEICVCDFGNSYIEAFTKEKMEFVLDQNLDYFKDFMMIIRKAMYG